MLNKIKVLKKDELVRGGLVLFIMIVLYNFFNYIFQISMARILGPSDYGIIAVLMSIIYVFAIPSEAIQTIITRQVSILSVKKEYGKIKDLLIRSLQKGLIFASIIFVLFAIFSIFLSSFLSIGPSLIIITGLFIFLVFLMPVLRGIIQGSKKFLGLGINMIFEATSKLVVAIGLTLMGWKVYGAMIGVIFGTLFASLLTLFSLKEIINSKRVKLNSNNIYKSSIPIIIATLCIVLMYSIDIILARRFFSSEIAGQYAFVSLIAKVIIFVSSAIGKTMFPISISEIEAGNKKNNVLKKSLIIVAAMAIISLVFYISIPEFIVRIISLGSTEYLAASHLLFNLGLAYSFISLAYIMILYKLSENKLSIRGCWGLIASLGLQIIFLSTYNADLVQYTSAMLSSTLLIFLYSLFLIRK